YVRSLLFPLLHFELKLRLLNSLSTLFIDIEHGFGTRNCCLMAMESLKKSLLSFGGSREELRQEFRKIVELLKNTSPRIALLMFVVFDLFEAFESTFDSRKSISEDQEFLEKYVQEIEQKREERFQKLLSFSESTVDSGDTILLHDVSRTTFDILHHAQVQGKTFQVVIAEQEESKTSTIIRFLDAEGIPFQVVPEYLLTHVKESLTKVFLGALTMNSLLEIIGDPGTESIVSQMHLSQIPIYVSLTTDKLSLWEAEKKHHRCKTQKRKLNADIEYEKVAFSHDRYPIHLIDFFITNKGVLSAAEMKSLYEEYYGKSQIWREKNKV
ncbi:MAG: hypothetical protein WCJ84_04615, partial [Candidatus Peregrinibacteria bacterium]